MNRMAFLLTPFLVAHMTDSDFKPWLTIDPTEVQLAQGATQSFRPNLNYPPGMNYIRPPVTWSVEEGRSGGTVTLMGLYTAPNTPGVYHVVVERTDAKGIRAIATVTVH